MICFVLDIFLKKLLKFRKIWKVYYQIYQVMYKNKYILFFVFLCFIKVFFLKGLEYKFRLFDFIVVVLISDVLLQEYLVIFYNEFEFCEIVDEMFQVGYINVRDYDDVIECFMKWK